MGPSFQWNLLNYGRIVSDVRYQDAKFRELLIAYQNTVLTANEETENGLVTFLRSQQQATILAHSVHDTQEALDMAIPLYMAGTTDAKGAAVIDLNRLVVIETTLVQQQDVAALSRGQIALGLIQSTRRWAAVGNCMRRGEAGADPPPAESVPLPSPSERIVAPKIK